MLLLIVTLTAAVAWLVYEATQAPTIHPDGAVLDQQLYVDFVETADDNQWAADAIDAYNARKAAENDALTLANTPRIIAGFEDLLTEAAQ